MLKRLPLRFFLLGLVTLFFGERALHETPRMVVSGAAFLCVLLALATAAIRYTRSQLERRTAHGRVLVEYAICTVALLMYAAQLPELGLIDAAGDAHTLVAVAWPAVLALGLVPAVTMELSIGGMVLTPRLELWRVGLAARAARIVALAVIGFAGLNYTAARWNNKVDLSYFKTAQPGTATLALAKSLTAPVRAVLFFPPGNEVEEQARGYLEELRRVSSQLQVETVDQARAPDLAKELSIRSNGFLALNAGDKTETMRLGLELESARSKLKDFDAEMQKMLLEVVRPPRVAYVTSGHLERDFAPEADDKRPSLAEFRTLLQSLGFTVKRLGLGEGLGKEIPGDATLVVIAGPVEPFLPAERAALLTYLQRGGRLLAAFDPDIGVTEDELLEQLGVRVTKALVGNPRYTVRVQGRSESPYDLVTTRTSSHATTTTLNRASGRLAVVMLGAGAVEKIDKTTSKLKQTFVLRAMQDSWLDEDGDREHDKETEKHSNLELAVALEGVLGEQAADKDAGTGSTAEQTRIVVLGDADILGSGVVRATGNAYFLADCVRWLANDEDIAGETESEKDVAIVHRKDEDRVWFYGTSFLFPAMILFGGLLFTNRGGRRRRRS